MPKNKRVSDIWFHFETNSLDHNSAKCKYCDTRISRGGKNAAAKGYTTTNMWAHVKRFHKEKCFPRSGGFAENGDVNVKIEENLEKDVLGQNLNRGQRDRKPKMSYCEDDDDDDPYDEEKSIQYEEYMITGDPVSEPIKEHSKEETPAKKRKASLEEQRIIAETEYFRQKASYFRMQTNLTALQAKKIKYELDQLHH